MSDLIVVLVLTAFVLGYVSLLLFIRLGSLGVGHGRILGIIIEVWLTFAVVIGMFILLQRFLAPVPSTGFPGELFAQIEQVNRLPIRQRLLIYGGLIVAAALLVHLLWSLRNAQRETPHAGQPSHGDSDDATT